MNTIIIHPNNRVVRTPAHDLSAALIAPVSRWYRKPTPWWVDSFEEVGLPSIVETDEIVEDVEETDEQEVSLEEIVLDDDQANELSLSTSEIEDDTITDIAFEDFRPEHSIDKPAISKNMTLDDLVLDNDLHGMEKDKCDYFFEEIDLVDEVDNDDQEADDDDTLMDITFTGNDATFRLQGPLTIVATESISEDEEEETIDWDHSNSKTNQLLQ